MNADVLTTSVENAIAVITLGSAKRIYLDKALDRALEIARRLASRPPEAVGYIKQLVRNATQTPLAQAPALERNLFLRLCISEPALARMRSYDGMKITAPTRSIEVETKERES